MSETAQTSNDLDQDPVRFYISDDDDDKDEIIPPSSWKLAPGFRRFYQPTYKTFGIIGEGVSATVYQCYNVNSREIFAMKAMKTLAPRNFEELELLEYLKERGAHYYNMVMPITSFFRMTSLCIVFPIYGSDLRKGRQELQKFSYYKLNQEIGRQILEALKMLKSSGVIHCDLKPENIVLAPTKNRPLRIKIIDFGLAVFEKDVAPATLAQTIYYRAPEVLVGTKFTTAIDMWSLGCILAEMAIGDVLYSGITEYSELRFMEQTQGPLPTYLLDQGKKTDSYYRRTKNIIPFFKQNWKLKTVEEYSMDNPDEACPLRQVELNSLDEISKDKYFIDFLKSTLTLDPEKRITPEHGLNHEFFKIHYSDQVVETLIEKRMRENGKIKKTWTHVLRSIFDFIHEIWNIL